ncbi:MAG: MFS transporter [Candidatus Krumholzibacteriota bacterium]|nr:MFS transporter [Candidatus Krumholzibacteriota bacterium]
MEQAKRLIKDSKAVRFTVLFMISVLMFGTYWFQDGLGPLKGLFESQLGFSSSQFGLLISSTTWANLALMIILGGIALDRWGIRKVGVILAVIATVGAYVVALGSKGYFGTSTKSMLVSMMIGRILFGIGLETTCVLISRTIVKWFMGKELAFAMGMNLVVGRLGSFIAISYSLDFAGGSIDVALVTAASVILVGTLLFLAYLTFDIKLDRQMGLTGEAAEDDKFKLSDLVKLITDSSFIYIALLCVAFYSAVFPFLQYAPDLLVNKFGFTFAMPDTSSMTFLEKVSAYFHNGPKVSGLIPLGTILFTPLFGSLVDRKGRAASLMILGSILLIYAHITLSVLNSVFLGYTGLFALGVAFSLVPAAMWPSLAKIVAENRLGTAYATMFTIQNYGLSAFYWGIGKVLDMVNPDVVAQIHAKREALIAEGMSVEKIGAEIDRLRVTGEIATYNYTIPILMLVALGIISIFLAFQLKKADKRQNYGLELPSNG